MERIRVLVVDDHNMVREGLVTILSYQSDIEVVGQARDGLQALEMLNQVRPNVVLLDMVMPNCDGLSAIPQIKQISPNTQILVLSGFVENELIFKAIRAGAIGYLLKDVMREQLFQAIRDVSRGLASLQPSIALRVIREINREPLVETGCAAPSLTQREMDTLRLVGCGYSNQEIASELFVNERTIAKYVSNILAKLHLENRTQAALYAMREGLTIQPEARL